MIGHGWDMEFTISISVLYGSVPATAYVSTKLTHGPVSRSSIISPPVYHTNSVCVKELTCYKEQSQVPAIICIAQIIIKQHSSNQSYLKRERKWLY